MVAAGGGPALFPSLHVNEYNLAAGVTYTSSPLIIHTTKFPLGDPGYGTAVPQHSFPAQTEVSSTHLAPISAFTNVTIWANNVSIESFILKIYLINYC